MARFLAPILVSIAIPLFFAFARRWMPRNPETETAEFSSDKDLPYGAAGAIMWAFGILVAGGGFLALRGINHLFAHLDRGAIMTLYPPAVSWVIGPFFVALSVPWRLTLYLLRRFGYGAKATSIVKKGNDKMNLDGERLMRWLAWGTLLPAGVLTALALPMRMSILPQEVRVVHYAHLQPNTFSLIHPQAAYWVESYQQTHRKDGSVRNSPDLVIITADGRRFRANEMGDGGTSPNPNAVSLLLKLTGLTPKIVDTEAQTR